MKEPYTEGIASHGDPESCVGLREGAGEALTGARAGRALSRVINTRGADAVVGGGRQHGRGRHRKHSTDPARSETPCMYGTSMRENREISNSLVTDGVTGRVGKTAMVARRR